MPMKLEWLGDYRSMVGTIYRAGNAYSMICKREILGDTVAFSPYEVQIMEYIMEYEDNRKNMSWYAHKMGLATSTYSKYVKKMVEKGLLEKYRASDNKKNVILRVSELGRTEYETYSRHAKGTWFEGLFERLDALTSQELKSFQELIELWGSWHMAMIDPEDPVELERIE